MRPAVNEPNTSLGKREKDHTYITYAAVAKVDKVSDGDGCHHGGAAVCRKLC
ncbi:MAG: hypothetical protein KTM48_03295 [Wolbachia endosymbiont of Pissodes strobi]|nr:hypothetical protein [Wolbachia endosymbiont of Pissodes strobi]